MTNIDLQKYITTTADFPKPGVMFRDFTPLFQHPAVFKYIIDQFAQHAKSTGATLILMPEARGFVIGSAVAYATGIPSVTVRKAGHLPPSNLERVTYHTEYGTNTFEISKSVIKSTDKVYIVDDLIAFGGTINALKDLIFAAGSTVAGLGFVMNLTYLPKKINLKNYNVKILVSYDK